MREKEMEIIEKKLSEIKPYEKNPRKNDDAVDSVANSIKEFGFKNPIVIDADGTIINGHTRYKAAKKLKLKTVPCVLADDLTPEQAKAFRLADNKTAELADWDFKLLDEELTNIFDIDMADFGFFADEEADRVQLEKENERQRTADAYNLEEFDKLACEGKYQMPKLHSVDYVPSGFIGFNEMLTSKDHDKGVHFYVDDYQFERIWNKPMDYLQRLFEFDCMLTPDFSLYTEMPLAMQIWNTYRSRLIGQMGQRMGLIVIPTVSWCREDSFEFCFDGLPKKSTLSVSTMGVKQEEYNFNLWTAGMDAMIERLKPERLLIYGGAVPYDYGNIEIVYYSNNVLERMKKKGEE